MGFLIITTSILYVFIQFIKPLVILQIIAFEGRKRAPKFRAISVGQEYAMALSVGGRVWVSYAI